MSKTNAERNAILNMMFGDNGLAWSRPATWYLALFTSMPTVSTGGTEVAGGSYARVAVTNNNANFPDPTAGVMANGADFTFVTASAAWGTVVGFGWFDALSGGVLRHFAPLTTPKTVQIGDTPSFTAGQMTFTET